MDRSSKNKSVFLPYFGEFGLFILDHVRFVHNHPAAHKVVCCRPGEECFFPSASQFFYDWKAWYDCLPDRHKDGGCAWIYKDESFQRLENDIRKKFPGCVIIDVPAERDHRDSRIIRIISRESFALKPVIKRRLKADVVVCCRKRQLAPERNYKHWGKIISDLKKAGYSIGIIGQPKTSFCPRGISLKSWDYPDSSAAIELLQNCKLFIGTDTGVSHIAAMMGVPMILFHKKWKFSNVAVIEKITKAKFELIENAWNKPEKISSSAIKYLSRNSKN